MDKKQIHLIIWTGRGGQVLEAWEDKIKAEQRLKKYQTKVEGRSFLRKLLDGMQNHVERVYLESHDIKE
jgi:hypothetical protein